MQNMKASKLIVDCDLYPRTEIDALRVRDSEKVATVDPEPVVLKGALWHMYSVLGVRGKQC